jgi:hypothetical protein
MGENPAQYLDDKTKENNFPEEMKRTYGTEKGLHKIIIKRINDAMTRMATKILAYKMLSKCRKEEVPARIIAAAVQCTNGTSLK